MSARTGPPTAQRRPAGNETAPVQMDRTRVCTEDTATNRQNRRSLQVWAERVEVAGRDRFRLEPLVWCVCGRRHMYRAPVDFIAGLRRGPCGAKYIVHAGVVAAVVA